MAKDLEKLEQNIKAFIERMVDKHSDYKFISGEDQSVDNGLPKLVEEELDDNSDDSDSSGSKTDSDNMTSSNSLESDDGEEEDDAEPISFAEKLGFETASASGSGSA